MERREYLRHAGRIFFFRSSSCSVCIGQTVPEVVFLYPVIAVIVLPFPMWQKKWPCADLNHTGWAHLPIMLHQVVDEKCEWEI